jgi:hypothetical protein
VPDAFYRARLPILAAAGLDRLAGLDPVAYNYSRETRPWAEAFDAMRRDAAPG